MNKKTKAQLEAEGREAHEFSFCGSGGSNTFCNPMLPHPEHAAHPPHIYAHYHTVRYGQLERFCLGNGDQYAVVLEKFERGNPEYPTVARGYWYERTNEEISSIEAERARQRTETQAKIAAAAAQRAYRNSEEYLHHLRTAPIE